MLPSLRFDPLSEDSIQHVFTLRLQESSTPDLLKSPELSLKSVGMPSFPIVQGEQPHSNEVATVDLSHAHLVVPSVDALVTNSPKLNLVIRTADCGPLFLWHPVHRAIGLAHSGKKGTALNILGATVEEMMGSFGTAAKNLIVVLGPTIRYPDYDIDFVSDIRTQAEKSGVGHFYDCKLNTAADLSRFYSYRKEKGKTGRHYSALCLQ